MSEQQQLSAVDRPLVMPRRRLQQPHSPLQSKSFDATLKMASDVSTAPADQMTPKSRRAESTSRDRLDNILTNLETFHDDSQPASAAISVRSEKNNSHRGTDERLEELEFRNKALTEQLESVLALNNELKKTAEIGDERAEDEIISLIRKVNTLESELAKSQSQSKEFELELSSLQKDRDKLVKQSEGFFKELQELDEKHSASLKQNADLTNQIVSLKQAADRGGLLSPVDGLPPRPSRQWAVKVQSLTDENDAMRHKCTQMEATLEKLTADMDKLRIDAKDQTDALQRQHSLLMNEQADVHTKKMDELKLQHTNQVDEMRKQLSKYQNQLDQVQKSLDEARKQLIKPDVNDVEQQTDKLEDQESAIHRYRVQLQKMAIEQEKMFSEHQSALSEISERADKDLADKDQLILAKEAEIKQLQQQVSERKKKPSQSQEKTLSPSRSHPDLRRVIETDFVDPQKLRHSASDFDKVPNDFQADQAQVALLTQEVGRYKAKVAALVAENNQLHDTFEESTNKWEKWADDIDQAHAVRIQEREVKAQQLEADLKIATEQLQNYQLKLTQALELDQEYHLKVQSLLNNDQV